MVGPAVARGADVVAVIAPERREAERATIETVADRLGEDLVVRTATAPTTRATLAAASSRGVRFAIGLDVVVGEIVVRRAEDETLLSRSIPPETWRGSPYSAALVALELLDLARAVPLKAPPPPPPPAPPIVVVAPPAASSTPTPTWGVFFAAQLGGVLDWSAGNEITLVRPSASVGVGIAIDALRLGVDLRLSPLGRVETSAFDLDAVYVRHDADLGVLGLYVSGDYRWGGGLRLGASYVDVEIGAEDPVRDRRTLPWAGLEARVERDVTGGLGVVAALGVDWVPSPPRFLVFDAPILYERGFRAQLAIGLRWASR